MLFLLKGETLSICVTPPDDFVSPWLSAHTSLPKYYPTKLITKMEAT